MNIGEATSVNMLLRYLLTGTDRITDIGARGAAAELADRANRAVAAGYTGEQVTAAWPASVVAQAAVAVDAQRQLDELRGALRTAAAGWAKAAQMLHVQHPDNSEEIERDAQASVYREVAQVVADMLATAEQAVPA